MGAGSTITIIAISLGCVGLGLWYYFQTRKNYQYSISKRLIPFTAAVNPTTGQAGSFTTPAGAAQISCPSGTVVNIVGAFFDISDPYGECTTKPATLISSWCNPNISTTQACTSNADCGNEGVMQCGSSGFCQLAPVSSASSCPQGYRGQPGSGSTSGKTFCVPVDLCGAGIPNPVCSASPGTNQCATRDATDSVGAKCNGRPECSDLDISDFGTYPCPNLAPTTCIDGYDSQGNVVWAVDRGPGYGGYCGLPYLPGWPGGAPQGSTGPSTTPQSSSIGYTLHGIYACVPSTN